MIQMGILVYRIANRVAQIEVCHDRVPFVSEQGIGPDPTTLLGTLTRPLLLHPLNVGLLFL